MTKYVFRSTTPGTAVQGSGRRIHQTRELSAFDRLEVHGPFEVELAPGATGPARLEGDDNLLALTRLDVDGGLLTVRLAAEDGGSLAVEAEQPLSLHLPVRDLGRIQAHATTRVRAAKALQARSLELECHGSAQLELQVEADELTQDVKGNAATTLTGRARSHVVRASGSAEVHAFDLAAEACEVKASGSAEVEVTARQRLQARASGKAHIAYRGDAAVDPETSGKGQVEKA